MRIFKKQKPKIFCIGQNKTGTTTIESVLKRFGYTLGNQVKGELLLDAWYQRDFRQIIQFCKSAQAFQDVPFSLPYTYQHLDVAFPNAKFILTERESAEQWYNSITKFHSKLWSDGEGIPTASELKNARYRYKGYAYQFIKDVYKTADEAIYDKNTLISHYNNYNKRVKDYFKSRPEKLIVINVSNSLDYANLCAFLNQPKLADSFPWENKTTEINHD